MRHGALLSLVFLIAVLFIAPAWAGDAPAPPSPAAGTAPAAPAPAPSAPTADANRRKEDETEIIKAKTPHPTVGRIVLFQLKNKHGLVVTRPAIVVHVWSRSDGEIPLINLQVFTDSGNDDVGGPDGIKWATSVHYDESKSEGTWCWMPYQLGQAAKTDDTSKAFADRIQRLEEVMATMALNFAPQPETLSGVAPIALLKDDKDGLRVH